jgi:hypothetical protein
MLSVTVPAIGCTGRKLEVGHWHPIQSNLNSESTGWQFKFVLEVTENGMLCCGQLELELQS